MKAWTGWKAPLRLVIAAAIVFGAQPVLASDAHSLDRDAVGEYNAALDAEQAGQNQTACRRYRNAAGLWENAIYALMGESMQTEDERDTVKAAADQLQAMSDKAKQKASAVCGLSDGPAQSGSSSSASDDIDWNAERKQDLQGIQTLAQSQYRDADAKYEAGDYAGACASAKRAEAGYTQIATALKADRALESAFANADQIYANAQTASEIREMFCAKAG